MRRQTERIVIPLAACLAFISYTPIEAAEREILLQGLFCNTEEQIDDALGFMSQGLTASTAVDFTNKNGVVCSYVDVIHYIVEHPVEIWQNKSAIAAAKYKGTLTGVVVGQRHRPISPPVEIFFATPNRLTQNAVERPS